MEADEVTAIVCKWARIWTKRTWGYVSYNEAHTDLFTIAHQVHDDNPECTPALMNKRMDWEGKGVNQKAVIRKKCMRERRETQADARERLAQVDVVDKPEHSGAQSEMRGQRNAIERASGKNR